MNDKLVSAVEWWKKKGIWLCSLICYDDINFSQLWLEPGKSISFQVKPGRYCIGYTTLPSKSSKIQASFEPWKAIEPCSNQTILKRNHQCSICYNSDMIQSCLACEGTNCLATNSIRDKCKKATGYVYLASFGLDKVKVGVAHSTRIPQRWIEQGANMAKRILIGNGFEIRKFEKEIHETINVFPGIKTTNKINSLWKEIDREKEKKSLTEIEKEIQKFFSHFSFFKDSINDLTPIYDLPKLDRRPIELKIKKNVKVSAKILGVKGSLLLLIIGDLPYYINLKKLIGKKIEQKKVNMNSLQTALDKF